MNIKKSNNFLNTFYWRVVKVTMGDFFAASLSSFLCKKLHQNREKPGRDYTSIIYIDSLTSQFMFYRGIDVPLFKLIGLLYLIDIYCLIN